MKRILLTILATLSATPAVAQTCSNSVEPTAPLLRYTLHDDGTVTDDATGLRWQRCPVGYTLDDNGTPLNFNDDGCDDSGTEILDWQGALQAAASLNGAGGFAGFNDWRLPNIKELMSTVERQCAAPAVNPNVFPDVPPGALFWSSTTYIHNDTASALDMSQGLNTTAAKQGTGAAHYARLVR